MTDIYERMEREELLYELRSAQKKIEDYEKIFSKNIQLNECKEILAHYENFDKLIYHISSKIVNIPIQETDEGIRQSLKLLVKYTDTVRSTIYLFNSDYSQIINSYEWSAYDAEAMRSVRPVFNVKQFQFFAKAFSTREIVMLGNLNDLPDDAEGERKFYGETGFRPTIMVPLINDGTLAGILGIYGRKDEIKEWNPQLAKQLHLIGDIIMSAINMKKSENELKTIERKFEEYFDRAFVGNVILDLDGKFINVNQKFADIIGYTKEEVLLIKSIDVIHPDDWNEYTGLINNLVNYKIENTSFDVRIIRKDKKIIYANLAIAAVRNIKDEISNLICVAIDITSETKNRQAIEGIIKSSSSKSGKMFFETMVKELSHVLNSNYAFVGEIKTHNEGYISTLAICDNKEIIDNIEFQIAGSPIQQIFEQGLSSVPSDIQTLYPEDILVKEFDLKCYIAVPLYNSKEEIIGVMGAMFTEECQSTEFAEFVLYLFASRTANELERMKNEEAMELLNMQLNEKNEELSQIIYVTSHDLRSPLVNVKGFSAELNTSLEDILEIIENEPISEDSRNEIDIIRKEEISEYVGFINSSIDKMDSLLSGLLRLSRLGRAAILFDHHDTNVLVSEVLQTFEFQIKENEIDVEIGELPEIYGDKIQLNQVFSNIIDNAIKYSDPERKNKIVVSGEKKLNCVVYKIQDQGIGIQDKDQSRVFEIFHRIAPKDENGIGLGMSLVKKIIERHSGSIWLESVWQKGTSFYVKLPLKRT